ncbi:hypothetical protein PSACC_03504 [Paramicrosporidium saccamoebae]|uniref:Uncharacterized protein n=1 Tax=Paramicrosporidium saccamoebae TaxID=1246581 RepID=A0A2H9TG65_9FUNG|nr:hypothetical protein PSACC_03504 [Paramicrosporidium saccamoebae]
MQPSRVSALCIAPAPCSEQSPKSRIPFRILLQRLCSRIRKVFRHKRPGFGPMTLSEYILQFGKTNVNVDEAVPNTMKWIAMLTKQDRVTCGLENHQARCRCPGDGDELLLALQEEFCLDLERFLLVTHKSIPLLLASEELHLEQLFQESAYGHPKPSVEGDNCGALESELLENELEMRATRIDSILAPQGLNVNMSDPGQKANLVTTTELANDDIMLALVFGVL